MQVPQKLFWSGFVRFMIRVLRLISTQRPKKITCIFPDFSLYVDISFLVLCPTNFRSLDLFDFCFFHSAELGSPLGTVTLELPSAWKGNIMFHSFLSSFLPFTEYNSSLTYSSLTQWVPHALSLGTCLSHKPQDAVLVADSVWTLLLQSCSYAFLVWFFILFFPACFPNMKIYVGAGYL